MTTECASRLRGYRLAIAVLSRAARPIPMVGPQGRKVAAGLPLTKLLCLLIASDLMGHAAFAATAVSIAVGSEHACVLDSTGGVKCWGDNQYGQLGDGTTTNRTTPVDVVGLTSGVAGISTNGNHTCALMIAGGVKCWGHNGAGQLGDGTKTDQSLPVDVMGLTSGVAGVSAGGGHTCAVTTAGAVKCWGFNFFGQVGIPVRDDDRIWSVPTPVDVPGLASDIVSVVAGSKHSCAITTGGGLKCWGSNQNGQLGFGEDYYPDFQVPAFFVRGFQTGVASVALGTDHTCAVTTAGAAKCWGANFLGPLGDGTEIERSAPVDVVGLSGGVARIAAGLFHTCAVTVTGGVQCWGDNSEGQLASM